MTLQGPGAIIWLHGFSRCGVWNSRCASNACGVFGGGTAGIDIADLIRGLMVSDGLRPKSAAAVGDIAPMA